MKHILLTTIAAVLVVGCRPPPPDISIYVAAWEGKEGNIEAVKQHIAAGTDMNEKDDNGFYPLHAAAAAGHREVAELLIANGADVNAKIEGGPQGGLTPLDQAIKYNRTETAALLRKHGGKTWDEL